MIFQNVQYGSDSQKISLQNIPIRKVQNIACQVNNKVTQLTIDSGCEGNCVRLDVCERLGIPVHPLDPEDNKVPTQADGNSPLDIVGQVKFTAVRGKVIFHFHGYVARTLNAEILCGGPFMESNKLVQELHKNRIIVDGKYTFLENSPHCPSPVPEVSVKQISSNDKDVFRHDQTDVKPPIEDTTSLIEIGEEVPKDIKQKLMEIHSRFQHVFDGDLTGGYNGTCGNFDVNFNFRGAVPPTPNYYSVPSYNNSKDDILMQAKIDTLEEQGVVIKVAATNIVPKYAAPCMLTLKHSARDLPPGHYDSLPIREQLKYNRFILCHDKLSEHVEKQPAKVNKLNETTRIVGSFEYVITTDLTDSFWQRHVSEEKLPYMAFHSPFRGAYFFLRSTQGLINQSEGLEELLAVALQDCIMSGWCRILADNIYVLGHTYDETVKRWRIVLELISACNLKLSPKKTAAFPKRLDLLGWTKQGKSLIPDPHRQNRLAHTDLPKTTKDLRSYLGSYRTFYRCQKDMSSILKPLEEFAAGQKSSERLEWKPELIQKFEESKQEIKTLDNLYLPKPEDQLVITSDWCEKGISATLWATTEGDERPKVVSRFSAKLPTSLENMLNAEVKPKTLPCDGEMSAQFVAAKSPTFSSHIKASNKRTVSLVDNKPVVEASKLIKSGKFSSSRVINNLMSAISEHNLEFQHVSAKLGQNFPDDFASRNPASCDGGSHCKICSFIKDCEKLTVGSLSFNITESAIVGQVKQTEDTLVQDILRGDKTVPFNNRQAMKYLQDQDRDLVKLRNYLTSAKRPTPRNTRENKIKRYLRKDNDITIAKDGCLVAHRRDNNLSNRELVVVPEDISMGLLYGMHINLNHPTSFQLAKVVDTKFFILDKDKKIKDLVSDCTLCQSVARLPEEIHTYKANEMPAHPGQAFTVDILRMCRKKIVVAVENFSGFVSTAFANSEKQEDLMDGIITTVSPFKAVSLAKIRVDQAPAFKALIKNPANLRDLDIELEAGECKNKNALALVDKKMQELEHEIKKAAPNNNVVSIKILARASTAVNEKIRHQGLSSKEILFSRDQFTSENLKINDEDLAKDKMEIRNKENIYAAKSKASSTEPAVPANARRGNLIFIKKEGSKLERRDLYLVTDTDEKEETVQVCKLPAALSGNTPIRFQPHNITYKLKQTDIYLSPNQPEIVNTNYDMKDPEPEHFYPDFPDEAEPIKCKKTVTYPYEDEDDEEDCDYIEESGAEDEANNYEDDHIDILVTELPARTDDEPADMDDLQNNASGSASETDDHVSSVADDSDDVLDTVRIDQHRLPVTGSFLSLKRKLFDSNPEHQDIYDDRWSTCKVTHRWRDKKKRPTGYFNVKFRNDYEKTIFLIIGSPGEDDLQWSLITEIEFMRNLTTPGTSLQPSNENSLNSRIVSDEDPFSWDHSSEQLSDTMEMSWTENLSQPSQQQLEAEEECYAMEDHQLHLEQNLDEAIEERDLYPDSPQECRLQRRGAFRRPNQLRPDRRHPLQPEEVLNQVANDLSHILLPNRPLTPQLVDVNRVQMLDRALDGLLVQEPGQAADEIDR